MKYNNQCEGTHYETPAIHTMEILSEGTLASSMESYEVVDDSDKFLITF